MWQQKSYQAKQMGPHAFETKGPRAPKWYVVDANDMVVGRLASVLARVITGKHKRTYTPHADTGDFVIVLNADKVVFTRNKWTDKTYYDYSGYIGGLKEKSAQELLDRDPEDILWRAVWGMTGKSTLARRQMVKLKLYASGEHPHQAQNPQPLPTGVMRKTILSKN